jgi:phytoene/squalene synthetase
LQLINFWQDLSKDIPRGRLYIPKAVYEPLGLGTIDFQKNLDLISKDHKAEIVQILCSYTEDLLKKGSTITNHLNSRRLKAELAAIYLSAEIMLKKNKEAGAGLFYTRPALKKTAFLKNLPQVSLFLLGLKRSHIR